MNRITQARCFISLMKPVLKNVALFASFKGQYNDNPKHISILLREKAPDIRQVWAVSSKNHERLPEYVTTVDFDSGAYHELTCRAQIVVDNYMGARQRSYKDGQFMNKIATMLYARKRRGQLCVSTWHGTPIKWIGIEKPNVHVISNSDYLISGCSITANVLRACVSNEVKINAYGTPRNDCLINETYDALSLKRKLGIPLDKKVLLYAPTFRENNIALNISLFQGLDMVSLKKTLSEKFGGEWSIVVRAHHEVADKLSAMRLMADEEDAVINGNLHDDMAEYLVCSDILLSDYSGSLLDFALTKKPCFIYAPDKDHYKNIERGFSIDFEALPFPIATDMEGLTKNIRGFHAPEYVKRVEDYLLMIDNCEVGRASQFIVEDILSFVRESK